MELRICHLYPDLLSQGGDRGNLICLQSRLNWRGIESIVLSLPLGEKADFSEFDLFYLGGGEDFEKEILLDDLNTGGKAGEIKAVIENGAVILAVCGGYQLLGNYRTDKEGRQWDFISAVDMHTIDSPERMTGNSMFRLGNDSGGGTVVGFENHCGMTYLGEGVNPLGTVLSGFGNNGQDKGEGVRYNNVYGSYNQGPVLPKNPELADFILQAAVSRKYPGYILSPLDDELEQKAHVYMVNRLTV